MIKKKEERIFDNPTPEQIKAVLEKAKKKTQEKKKGSAGSSPDKMDILLEKIEGLVKRQDRIEGIVTAVGAPSSEKKATDQEKQAIKTNEQLLSEVELEQERAQGKQEQPGQPQAQLTPEQYQALSPEKKVPILEAQLQAQQQQPNTGKGGLNGQAALYGLLEIAKTTSPVIIEAIKAKGANNGAPLNAFFNQLGVYQKIESTIMDGFFNFMRNLSPGQRQVTMDSIATSGPGKVEIPKTDDRRIK
ncbi:hypothetical protein ES703_122776 [subsurface metagenome]